MLSKNQIKLIAKLKQKKHRQDRKLFVVEGIKAINELLQSAFKLHHVYTTERLGLSADYETIISEATLNRISFLTTPNQALALFEMPEIKPINAAKFCIALDNVRDPGNLGTIIRLCDWFGVEDLICNLGTVDCYNPKVVQATMGSITRVNITYLNLESFLVETDCSVFGAFMDGENVYKASLPDSGILVMGNEANGITPSITSLITQKLAIPRFGQLQATESLNVATATSILLSEFKRRTIEM